MKIYEVKERDEALIATLLDIWESSVRATHHFLTDKEIRKIKEEARLEQIEEEKKIREREKLIQEKIEKQEEFGRKLIQYRGWIFLVVFCLFMGITFILVSNATKKKEKIL